MKKEKKYRGLWKKIHVKYRVSVTNESTLDEFWRIKSSIFTGIVLLIGFAFFLIALTSVIIITTPIRYYLPGYMETEVREEAVKTAIKVDSLEQAINIQQAYINNIRYIISGDLLLDSVTRVDSVYIAENDPVLEKSERERQFVTKYEEEEKYTLGILPPAGATSATIFYKPIRGVVINRFDALNKVYDVTIQTAKTENVLAVLDGTVIFTGYDAVDKYTIQVQHKNGFVSIYKGCTQLIKNVGETVKSNQAIGLVESEKKKKGDKETKQGGILLFELWNKGTPVNPETYITFK